MKGKRGAGHCEFTKVHCCISRLYSFIQRVQLPLTMPEIIVVNSGLNCDHHRLLWSYHVAMWTIKFKSSSNMRGECWDLRFLDETEVT